MRLLLSSPAFDDKPPLGEIPKKYGYKNENSSSQANVSKSYPLLFCVRIISASDLHSDGTLDMDNGGLEFSFLYPYFFGISPLSSNAGLESKSLICKVFCMQK